VQGTASTISLSTFLTNTGGLAITYAVGTGSLPSGVTLSTAGVLSYNGTGAVASSTVQFRASSGVHVADSSSTSVGIAAYVPTNRAPVWSGTTSLGSYSNGSAQSIPLAAYASDPDADPLTFTRQGGTAPAGVTVNASTGVLTIPLGTAAGSYTVIVRASDASLYADRTFTVTVTAANTFAVTGSGFGTKSSLTPALFLPLVSNADGQTAQAAGLSLYNTEETTSPATAALVTSSRTLGQSKSIRWRGNGQTAGQNTAVPIFATHLPANAQSVLISGWFNISRIGATTSGAIQLKMHRTGVYGSGSVDNANNHYGASPHESCSIFTDSDITWLTGTNGNGFNTYADMEDTVAGSAQYNSPDPMIAGVDTWWHYQAFMRYTDIGQANGEFALWINNTLIANRTGLTNRTLVSQYYQWASVFTGFQMFGRDWDVYFTRPYIDVNTRAHAWLGNASTASACTGRWLLEPTSWSDTQVVVTGVDSRPSGYDWAYVTNSSGTTNSAGVAVT
jgi:hypothetical protein